MIKCVCFPPLTVTNGERERERERWGGREKKWEPYMCDGEVSVLYGEREREGGEGERKSGVYACRNV